jgi:hypothetical protein
MLKHKFLIGVQEGDRQYILGTFLAETDTDAIEQAKQISFDVKEEDLRVFQLASERHPLNNAVAHEIEYIVNQMEPENYSERQREIILKNIENLANNIASSLGSFVTDVKENLQLELERLYHESEHVFTEEELINYLQGLGFDVFNDDNETINLSFVYEQAINEGFTYNEQTGKWEK